MAGLRLEIGATYKRRGKIYLAVKPNLMVTYIKQELKETRARKGFVVERSLPVGILLEEWGISSMELDRIAFLYLQPPLHRNVGVRQRRTHRRGASPEELEIFRSIRTYQIFTPHHKSI